MELFFLFFFVAQVAVSALRVLAAARTVAAPKESPRGAPIAIQTEIVPRVVLDITSRATSAFYVVVEKQALLDQRVPVPV